MVVGVSNGLYFFLETQPNVLIYQYVFRLKMRDIYNNAIKSKY